MNVKTDPWTEKKNINTELKIRKLTRFMKEAAVLNRVQRTLKIHSQYNRG